jgi:DNA repair protein RadA/Sms
MTIRRTGGPSCRRCGESLRSGAQRCRVCGHYTFISSGNDPGTISPFRLVPLSSVDESVVERRIRTGMRADSVFGGPHEPGIVRTSANIISGFPGGGKSTLACMLVSRILESENDRPAFYLGNEQIAAEIKKLYNRLRLPHMERFFIPEFKGTVEYPLPRELLADRPCVIVQDSLPGVEADDGSLHESERIAGCLKDASAECECPTIAINHVIKDGDMAGTMKLQHKVDALFMFAQWPTRDAPVLRKLWTYGKNRNGASHHVYMDMVKDDDSAGLVEHAGNCDCEYCEEEE